MKARELDLKGAFELTIFRHSDDRGVFFKPFQENVLKENGIYFEVKESISSSSRLHVLRGMHYQASTHPQAKLVYCPHGAILDIILDIRKDSPTFGKYAAVELSEANGKSLYIPHGFAHGFMALTEGAITSYLMDAPYEASADKGILWDSFGMKWPFNPSRISARDASFLPLSHVPASDMF